ncbi:MAG: glutamate formimidoyltransferase [Bacteroidales bacterium]|nr:glutamate formimidoyltransferase [Bacteroidales bacterium]
MKKIIECIPNVSEGRDRNKIEQLTKEITSVTGVHLLNIDTGALANRTVFTFIGTPEDVIESAYRLIKKAAEIIDMRIHKGTHPRIGAVDVCPFVPVKGMSIEEAVLFSDKLAQRVGSELGIPVFSYAYSSKQKEREKLENIRQGQYEKLKTRIKDSEWKPDFGPAEFNAKFGAVVIGTRDFLIAYNISLNTRDTAIANKIASEIRESGSSNNSPGLLKAVKAIGWYVDEYNCAQVSMNIVDYKTTSVIKAYETVKKRSSDYGIEILNSEIVGMIPVSAIIPDNVRINDNNFWLSREFRQILKDTINNLQLNIDADKFKSIILEYRIYQIYGVL